MFKRGKNGDNTNTLPTKNCHTMAPTTNCPTWDKYRTTLKGVWKRHKQKKGMVKAMLDRISLILVIIGALNWGSVGLFKFDLVSWICGGQDALWARIIYTVVALAGLWCISLLFRPRESEYYEHEHN